MDRTGPQVHVAPVRCPFCHEGIPKGEAPAVCAECHALHHAPCMSEHGACAACGRKTSSPEDSKLEAALRARASVRAEQRDEKLPRTTTPTPEVELDAKPGRGMGTSLLLAALGAAVALFLIVFLLLPLVSGPSELQRPLDGVVERSAPPTIIINGRDLSAPRELADRAVLRAAEAKRLSSTDPASARRAVDDALSMIDQAIADVERLLDQFPGGHSDAIEKELDRLMLEKVSIRKLKMELVR